MTPEGVSPAAWGHLIKRPRYIQRASLLLKTLDVGVAFLVTGGLVNPMAAIALGAFFLTSEIELSCALEHVEIASDGNLVHWRLPATSIKCCAISGCTCTGGSALPLSYDKQ
eukprot:4842916-Amphidinium_carterae.1